MYYDHSLFISVKSASVSSVVITSTGSSTSAGVIDTVSPILESVFVRLQRASLLKQI